MADRYQTGSGAGAARVREPIPETAAHRATGPEEVAIVGERSTVDIIKDIATNIQDIVRSEIRLASAEMKAKVTKASKGAIAMAAGGVLLLYAFGFLLTCIYQAIHVALWAWLSALIVAVGLAIPGAMMVLGGWKRVKNVNPKPEMAVRSVREDVQWLKNQTR